MKLYVRRVFITDEAQLLPRYLGFVRGVIDSNDLPLNVSREMIQESPVLAAIQKGVANRVLSQLEGFRARGIEVLLLAGQVGDAGSRRASDRLTASAVCLVAPEHGMDRQLEKLLAGAGRLDAAAKPVLEINPHHPLVEKLSAVDAGEQDVRTDAAHLLFDEARIADGELPADPRAFSARLMRLLERGLG